ncbi:exported hypothetical protein [Vibrio chagasii]|nr:exported hypothetical protein [Vibrio chagasii]
MKKIKFMMLSFVIASVTGCSTTSSVRDSSADISGDDHNVEASPLDGDIDYLFGYEDDLSLTGSDAIADQLLVDLQKKQAKLEVELKLELEKMSSNHRFALVNTDKLISDYQKSIAEANKLIEHYETLEVSSELLFGVQMMIERTRKEVELLNLKIARRSNEIDAQDLVDLMNSKSQLRQKFAIENAKAEAQYEYELSVIEASNFADERHREYDSQLQHKINRLTEEVAGLAHETMSLGVDSL